jgi:BirA family transcriptional regulator, biotin operon repressor / biotin---[acetyl-CoA-carboxylase] ligase
VRAPRDGARGARGGRGGRRGRAGPSGIAAVSDGPAPAGGARVTYDGFDAEALRRLTGAPRVELCASVGSVLDLAHELAAAGAPSGLLVVADEQTAGRGRQGRVWHSPAGSGLWVAALLRPEVRPFSGALAIRAGLAAVEAVGVAAPAAAPRLKWPNDVIVAGRKAGGILCEARWSGGRQGWIAVGVGINVRGPVAAAVRGSAVALGEVAPGVTRPALLAALAPRLRALAERPSALDEGEREAFRRCQSVASLEGGDEAELAGAAREGGVPEPLGVDGDGALLVVRPDGTLDRRVIPV